MWCKSVGFVCWLAPLLILRSVGFSVFFCRIVIVRRVSRGIGHNTMKKVYIFALVLASLVLSISKSNGQTITSFTPFTAKSGDAVTITGTGFNTQPTMWYF